MVGSCTVLEVKGGPLSLGIICFSTFCLRCVTTVVHCCYQRGQRLLQTSLNTAPVFTAAVKQRVLACNGPPLLTLVVCAVTCLSLGRLSGDSFVEGWVRGLMSFIHQDLFVWLFMADKYIQNTKIQKSMEALLFFFFDSKCFH